MPTVSLNRQDRIMQELLPANVPFTEVTTTYQMKAEDHFVRIAAGGTYTITLPPVAEARGQIYAMRVISGTSTVTIVDKGDAAVAISDTVNAAGEGMVMFSDGGAWHFFVIPPA